LKNVVMMLTEMLLLTLTLSMLTAVYGRMNYSMELQSNLSSVMETQLNKMMLNEEYNIINEQEFLADFVENLIVVLDGEYNLTVDILQLDMDKGILAVRVTADFQYINGKKGTTSCERVVIFNQLQK